MKNTTRHRAATAVLVAALGIGTLSWAMRSPGFQRAIARLRGESPQASGAATAPAAVLVSGSRGASVGATQVSLKSGTFTGRREYAYYGYVRVRAVVQNGTLSDIKVLEYPSDNGTSQYINSIALPYLIQEAVGADSWKVDLISGATFTSVAFLRSLQNAMQQAGA